MDTESSKMIAGIGSLMIAISFLVFVGWAVLVIGLIGVILALIGIKGLADSYGEPGIFNNALWALIFMIIGVIAFVVITVFSVFVGITGIAAGDFSNIWTWITGIIIGFVVLFVFFILHAVYIRKSFSLLSNKTGEKLFDTAGLVMLIGAILTIVIVGVVILLIAWILAAVAFFTMRTTATPPPPPPPTTAPPSPP